MQTSLLSSFNTDLATLVLASTVPLALGIDRYLGEPSVRWHPVVWMGRYLGRVGQWLTPLPEAGLQLEAARTPSPNSGWPMAAMALGLQVCLSKPRVCTLNPRGNPPLAQDTQRAIAYASHVVAASSVVAVATILLLSKVSMP